MSAVSAIGGIQQPYAPLSAQRPDKVDPVTPPQKVERAEKGSEAKTGPFYTSTSNLAESLFAARVSEAAAQPKGDDDAIQRALIGQVFKIDEEADIAEMFGDIDLSSTPEMQEAKRRQALDDLRQAVAPPAASTPPAARIDTRA